MCLNNNYLNTSLGVSLKSWHIPDRFPVIHARATIMLNTPKRHVDAAIMRRLMEQLARQGFAGNTKPGDVPWIGNGLSQHASRSEFTNIELTNTQRFIVDVLLHLGYECILSCTFTVLSVGRSFCSHSMASCPTCSR